MAYSIVYNGIEGQAGLYARVQRKFDGLFWNGTGSVWQSAAVAACNVALIETVGTPGEYTGSAGLTPAKGGMYIISVYTSADLFLHGTEDTYLSDQMTALQIINEVQRQLRLPQSVLISEPHAQLLLSFINEVQLDYMMEFVSWDDLKIKGSIATVSGISVYPIVPINRGKVDMIRSLQIGTADPLVRMGDALFREYQNNNQTGGEPKVFRQYVRAAGSLIVELCPVPDAAYLIDYETLMKPEKLTAAADVPILDEDTIILGTKYLAKKDQGDDVTAEIAAFHDKLSLQGGSQTCGDVEFL